MKFRWFGLLIAFLLSSCGDYIPISELYAEQGDVPGDDDHRGSDDNPGDHQPNIGNDDKKEKRSSDSRNPMNGISSSSISFGKSSASRNQVTSSSEEPYVAPINETPVCDAANEGVVFTFEGQLKVCSKGEWTLANGVSCKDGKLVEGVRANAFGGFGGNDDSDTADVGFRRTGANIVGIAQKGPFRAGAEVRLVELDSAMRLADSKRYLTSCIVSSDGSYDFKNVDLVSPYVRVEASGYYLDELSGAFTNMPVTLKAIVDLTEQDTVNVNMLTYLEAPRVLKLVENSGYNQPIRSVKAQALKDVLSAFEINFQSGNGGGFGGFGGGGWGWNPGGQTQQPAADNNKVAEKLNLFGTDDYSGALLAVSIMMQRNGGGSAMLSYADGIAERIKGNGGWDDNAAKADLADWLVGLDSSGAFERIKRNMAAWNMGDVPDFESHLQKFWTKALNLETCGGMNYGQVKVINNSMSAYFASNYESVDHSSVRFICDKEMKKWRVATDIEKDTVGFGAGTFDGQIREGKINTNKYYVYEQMMRAWRPAREGEVREFVDIADVYKNLAADETVVFILRHAARTDDTGIGGHLTDTGKKQSQQVGAKLKGADIYFGNSTYTRTIETCENIATGAGVSFVPDTLPFMDGDWFVTDADVVQTYRDADGGGWNVFSKYAYQNAYKTGFYDLEERSKEMIFERIIPRLPSMKRVNVLISHDQMVLPLTIYCTDKKINLRYYENQNWINYLAGVAIIVNKAGDVRYEAVRGLESGVMH